VEAARVAVPKPATPTEREAAAERALLTSEGERLLKRYDELSARLGGPAGVRGRYTSWLATLDVAQVQDVNDFVAEVNMLKARLVRNVLQAGGQIGPAEKELYYAVMPDATKDSSVQFKSHLRATLKNIDALERINRGIQEREHIIPPTTERGAAAPAKPAATLTPAQERAVGRTTVGTEEPSRRVTPPASPSGALTPRPRPSVAPSSKGPGATPRGAEPSSAKPGAFQLRPRQAERAISAEPGAAPRGEGRPSVADEELAKLHRQREELKRGMLEER